MSDAEMEALIASTAEEGLHTAYTEMLTGSRDHPEERLWYAAWKFCRKDIGEMVGNACFMGPAEDCAILLVGSLMDAADKKKRRGLQKKREKKRHGDNEGNQG